jgi:hypothetical protein
VAEQKKSEAELHMGNVQRSLETISNSTTTNCSKIQDQTSGLRTLSQLAEASITEEPGAGKPHAGICAGVAG